MPNVTLHLHLAERVLDHWRVRPHDAPFPTLSASTANAFRQGAFGPDLGYFPGGNRILSDLAHCHRSGDLTRELLASARTPTERAWSLGWITHVLADYWIHPLIGCAVGELLHGSAAWFVDGDSDPVAHVRVESGLDALYAERHPELRAARMAPVFDAPTIRFLVDAYEATYGVVVDPAEVLRSHQLAARRSTQGLAITGLVALTMPWSTRPRRSDSNRDASRTRRTVSPLGAGAGEGALRAAVGRRSQALAFLLPTPPPLWLIDATDAVTDDFVARFLEGLADGLRGLGNPNLDTGQQEEEARHHGGFRRCAEFLETAERLPARALAS
ncbi:MAG TPA: zinc dependent phospholipase C family protein [Longimicrobiales bacterium]